MTVRKVGTGLIAMGFLGVVLSLLADLLPGANAGIQATQILGIEIGIAVLLIGLWVRLSGGDEKLDIAQRLRQAGETVIHVPTIAWVLAGFFIAYLLFFIWPMFLNADLRMNYFNRYLPDRFPIGNDLILIIDLARSWFATGQSPFTIGFYPPFTYVFFSPLLLIDDYPTIFKLFTLFNLLSYCFLALVLPLRIAGSRHLPLVLLFFVTGLSSYGLQFELERGQYNVFTFLLCLWAIYLFHYHPKLRLLAYILFSISIQLKIYPAICIVMLVDDWRDWKGIIRRFAGLAAFNVLLLFAMGWQMFWDFLGSVSAQLATPGWTWNGNHSINAFVFNLGKDGYRLFAPETLESLRQNAGLIESLLLLTFVICFICALVISYRRNEGRLDPYLLLTCTVGALIIPISNDYTLSIFAAPVAIVLAGLPEPRNVTQRLLSILLVVAVAFCYASTLIPFKYKPYYMNNAFPPLFLILIFVTLFNVMRYRSRQIALAQDPVSVERGSLGLETE